MISLAFPIILMIGLRLAAYRTFPALLLNLGFTLFYNLSLKYINLSDGIVDNLNIWNNLMDAPLMLLFLTYFSTSPAFAKKMRYAVVLFILFELTVILAVGYNLHAITIIIGPGLAIVFAFCLHFFIRQTKITIMHRKASGKAIMAAALLFGYGSYTLIYVMYYVLKTPFVADTFLVYFLSVTFSSLLLSAGILIERKRIQKLNELKLTRKELSIIYKEHEKTTPFRTALLDLDKDKWN
jgi:hypothetical protein